jgi:hypothetical protein
METAFVIAVTTAEHFPFAERISEAIEESAHARGTGIARRSPEYIREKMREGKAVIALTPAPDGNDPRLAGFCYIETWSEKKYVANSGLIVLPEFRHSGLARAIKARAFVLSREKYPGAKLFGITTSHAVMKINTDLGYIPVPFSELTSDDEYWNGCRSCPNHDILVRTNRKMCLCTGMLFDPEQPRTASQSAREERGGEGGVPESRSTGSESHAGRPGRDAIRRARPSAVLGERDGHA